MALACVALAPIGAAQAALEDGPGGPILVITGAADEFGGYYAEILRNEGLNAFDTEDLATVTATPAILDGHDVAILGATPLTGAQVTMLSDWVQAGGNLIAMRPDAQLAGLLDLTPAGGTLGDAYLKVDTTQAPGAGIVGDSIQFHGTADTYTPAGATTVAALWSNATTPTTNPAVTLTDVGPNGGQAASFAYDLARSVVTTRQGNPAWAGQNREPGPGPIRAGDMFYPDWIDLDKVAVPQADEQQRLLANLIAEMNADRSPLPRFWYLPRGEKAAVVMTGDDHANGGTAGRFDRFAQLSAAGCSVADWECVRGTSYIYPSTPLSDAQAAAYEAAGFEVSLHVDTGCANSTQAGYDTFVSTQLGTFAAEFPSVPAPTTNRNHCIAWEGWADTAEVEANRGIRLDTNYYYWPESWIDDRPGMFTGSGFPMRFADVDGSLLDVYQATTQMTDESGQEYPATIDALLDNAVGSQGHYGVFTANIHTDSALDSRADAIVASAQSHGVPVVTARQMLRWLDGRNGSSFGSIDFTGNTLSFTIAPAAGANGLQAMVPAESESGALTAVARNGTPVSYSTQTIKGVDYAFVGAAAGAYEATYAAPTTATGLLDTTTQHFSAGSGDMTVGDGEVALTGAAASDFGGMALPLGWSSAQWTGGGTNVGGGQVTVDGGKAFTSAAFSAGREMEFVATFGGAPFQHVGFGTDYNDAPWAMFSTNNTSDQLWMRTATSMPGSNVALPLGQYLGEPHRYRIVWNASSVEYFIDGVLKHTEPVTLTTPMRPIASDYTLNGPTLSVDWLRVSPYGSFTSRVFDANATVDWGQITFDADPAVRISVRTGDTPVPDGGWSPYAPVSSGDAVAGQSRYLQYRATIAADAAVVAPVLRQVEVSISDTGAPNTTIDSGPTGTITTSTAQFAFSADEPATFACRIDGGPWTACSSPKAHTGLTDGSHSFEVRATDTAGNTDATPASRSFTVATGTGPEITINRPWQGARYSHYSNDKPAHRASYACTAAVSCSAEVDSTPVADGAPFPRPNPGTAPSVVKTFTVTATDGSGNTATKSVTYRVYTFRTLIEELSPVAYYRLNDGHDTAEMAAVAGPAGEYKNGQDSEPWGISGDGDASRFFTGADGYAYVNGITAPRRYTLSTFVNFAEDDRTAMVMQHGGAGAIWYDGDRLHFRPVEWDSTELTSPAIGAQKWHHVAGTFGSGTARLYLDGELVDSATSTKEPSGTSTFYLGYGDKAPWLRGGLDEAAYFGRVLDVDQIHQIWLADPPPARPAPAATSETSVAPAATTAPTTATADSLGVASRPAAPVAGRVIRTGRTLTVTIRCSGTCSGTAVATAKLGGRRVVIGTRRFMRAGKVTIRLTKAMRRKLAAARRPAVTVRVRNL